MQPVRRSLLVLHEHTFGRPWTLAAISVLAIWALWHGLLRARTTQTLTGLALSVLLMACAQAMIYRPAEKGYLLYSVGVNGLDDGGRSYGDDPPGDDLVVRMPQPALRNQ